MKYIPSPINISYGVRYQAVANKSGRMQYYKQELGKNRIRIGRQDFIYAYNQYEIIALRPLPEGENKSVFQLEFYVINHN